MVPLENPRPSKLKMPYSLRAPTPEIWPNAIVAIPYAMRFQMAYVEKK